MERKYRTSGNPKKSATDKPRRRHGNFTKGIVTCAPPGLLTSDLSGTALDVIGVAGGSVDGQGTHATGATAGAAEVAGIASGCLHRDVETSGSGDHGGANGDRQLRTALHGGGESGAVEDHHGRGNELAAGRGEYETGRQL